MKHFKRKIVTLGLAVVLLVGSSSTVFAASNVCTSSPDGYHHFDDHRMLEAGYTEPIGYHSYIAYYVDGQPVYKSDCLISTVYKYCDYICVYCRSGLAGATHAHAVGQQHSIFHN